MNSQEVDVMTTFYCDRLEDEASTKENIMGLSAMHDMPGFGENEAIKLCNGYILQSCFSHKRLFKEIDMTRHLQSTRMAIYTLIDSMMKKQRKGSHMRN